MFYEIKINWHFVFRIQRVHLTFRMYEIKITLVFKVIFKILLRNADMVFFCLG